MTSGTSAQEHRLLDAVRIGKLSHMLQNTLRNWPQAKLLHGAGGFGVSLGDETCLYVRAVGPLTPEQMRDLLVLFATWLTVDPGRLFASGIDDSGGASALEKERKYLSNGVLD